MWHLKKIIAVLVCLTQPSWATWSFIANFSNTGGGSPCAVTVSAISAHDTLLACVNGGTGSLNPISAVASTGDTWTNPSPTMSSSDASSGFLDCWYLLSAAGSETTVTLTSTANTTACTVRQIRTTANPAIFDTAGIRDQTTGTGTPAGVTLTLGGSNDAVIQNIKGGGTVSAITTYANFLAVSLTFGHANLLNTVSGTAPTWTQTAGNNAALNAIAFKETGGAAATVSGQAVLGAGIISGVGF